MSQRQVDDLVDKNYEKIKEKGVKVFICTGDTIIAEEWLQNTERILYQIDCTNTKKISYAMSLLQLDILSW